MNFDVQHIREDVESKTGKSPPLMFLIPVEQIRHVAKGKDDKYEIAVCLISGNRVFQPITVTPNAVLRPDLCLLFGNKDTHLPTKEEWEEMCRVFNTLLRFTPERQVYNNVGMNAKGTEYILGNIRIQFDCVGEIENSFIRQPIGYDLSGPPDLCLKLLAGCFKSKVEGIVCFLTLLLSFTLSSLEHLTTARPSFVLLLIGRSGSFKTSFAQAAFGFYGGSAVSSFRDTKASMVETIKGIDDTVCLIDDFSNYLSSDQNEKLEELVRLNGDRTSVRKIMVGRKPDTRSVNTMSVVTGEDFPIAPPSSIARMAILDVNDAIDPEGLTQLQESQLQYIGSIVQFIQFLLKDKAAISRLVEQFKHYRNNLTRSDSTPDWHPRYTDMYSWLAAGWDMWSDYRSMQGVSPAEYGNVQAQLFDFVKEQHRKYLKSDVISVFFDTVGTLIANGKLSVVDISNLGPDNLKPRFDVIYDGAEIHYESQRVFAAVSEYCFRNGIAFQISAGKFYDTLAKEGLLQPRRGQRNTGEFRKKGIRESTICIYRNRLARYLNNLEGDDPDDPGVGQFV